MGSDCLMGMPVSFWGHQNVLELHNDDGGQHRECTKCSRIIHFKK